MSGDVREHASNSDALVAHQERGQDHAHGATRDHGGERAHAHARENVGAKRDPKGEEIDAAWLPPIRELFSILGLAARHPDLLKDSRIRWAVRNRACNGLAEAGAVFETRSSGILIREPAFLAWWLGLTGRAKPRATRRPRRRMPEGDRS